MSKGNLILAALSAIFALGIALLHHKCNVLRHELAANSGQCEQQVKSLRSDHQAEIDTLQEVLGEEAQLAPGSGSQPRNDRGTQQQAGGQDGVNAQTVDRKYRYMYDQLDQPEPVKEILRQLLLERDQLAAEGVTGEQMGAMEGQIGELLGAGGYQDYQLLKDSDSEQHHLREYAESVSELAPLTPAQERALLFTKLKHKQIFHRALADAGFYQQYLTEEGRGYARIHIPRALQTYKNGYLNEVRSLLSSEQYTKLQNYETTEFNWEQERLLKQVDAKAESPHY